MQSLYSALVVLIRAACARDGETPGPGREATLEATRTVVLMDERAAEFAARALTTETGFDWLLSEVADTKRRESLAEAVAAGRSVRWRGQQYTRRGVRA